MGMVTYRYIKRDVLARRDKRKNHGRETQHTSKLPKLVQGIFRLLSVCHKGHDIADKVDCP